MTLNLGLYLCMPGIVYQDRNFTFWIKLSDFVECSFNLLRIANIAFNAGELDVVDLDHSSRQTNHNQVILSIAQQSLHDATADADRSAGDDGN